MNNAQEIGQEIAQVKPAKPEAWEAAHAFERAGLGKAPFRFKSAYKERSSCDYCGTAIVINCLIESSDGKTFKVGSDCVCKVGDSGLTKSVNKALRAHRRELRVNRCKELVAEAKAILADPVAVEILAKLPHSRGFINYDTRAPLNFVDEVNWLLRRGGVSGRQNAAKLLIATYKKSTQPVDESQKAS